MGKSDKMKVLYVHQYFCTPEDVGGTRSYWISKELVRRGHHVTMITSTHKNHPEAGREDADGIDVIYVKNPRYNNYLSVSRKIWAFVAFIWNGIMIAMKEKDVDVVFATSTPLTVGAIALWLKWRRGWKYVFEVRDLWPQFPIEIGAVKNGMVIWGLRKFEKCIYEKAEHIIALSPGIKVGVTQVGIPDRKVTMVPNMSKPDIFYPHEPYLDIANKLGIDLTKFNVVYFGSMGPANGLLYVIEAAKRLKDRGDDTVRFLFMGSGATDSLIQKTARDYGLSNVQFLGEHKMDIVSEVVNCCDASMVLFLNLPVLRMNSPNKFFDSLSAGKPIIVNSAGWTKDVVEQNNCGLYVDPEKPEQLAEKLQEIKDDKDLLKTWGNYARKLSIEVYDKAILSAKVADVLEMYGS